MKLENLLDYIFFSLTLIMLTILIISICICRTNKSLAEILIFITFILAIIIAIYLDIKSIKERGYAYRTTYTPP